MQLFLVDERNRCPINVGNPLHKGGEAEIREVPDFHGCLAKVYPKKDSPRHATREKLEAMLTSPPRNLTARVRGVELPQFTWPTHLIVDEDESVRGFLMRELPQLEVVMLTKYMSRKQQKPLSPNDRSLPGRLVVCANLAAMVAEMHRLHHLVVDLKPANIAMFKDTGILCLLDNDSFSITKGPKRYPATAMSPEYRAPEVLANRLEAADIRDEGQDRFALAVVIFQILNNGVHPFAGRPRKPLDPWHIELAIQERYYAYALEPSLEVQPAPASVHTTWPEELRCLFDRAFMARTWQERPSASEWRNYFHALVKAKGTCVECEARCGDVTHIHFAGLPCHECLFEAVSARLAADTERKARDKASSSAASAPPSAPPVDAASAQQAPTASGWRKKLLIAAIVFAALVALLHFTKESPPHEAPAPTAAPVSAAPPADSASTAAATTPARPEPEAAPPERLSQLSEAVADAWSENVRELAALLIAARDSDLPTLRERAVQAMRNTSFTGGLVQTRESQAAGRRAHADTIRLSGEDFSYAARAELRAVALAPLERELAADLAYYQALVRDPQAQRTAVYALSLPRAAGRTGTSVAWQALAITLVTAGHMSEAELALAVALAITDNVPGFCQSLLLHERRYGEGLRPAITAVFRRIEEGGLAAGDACRAPRW